MIPFCDDGTPEASFLDPEGGGRAGTHPPTVRGNPGGGDHKKGSFETLDGFWEKGSDLRLARPKGCGGGSDLKKNPGAQP